METSAPFELDQAVGQWRANLQHLGSFRAEELDELEGHLRESITVLHAKGLPVQEAFMIAARRLGSERQLSDEFAKANPQRLWTERAMWMVAGMLVCFSLSRFAAPFPQIVINWAPRLGLSGHLVGALQLLAGRIAWVGVAAIAYWNICRHPSRCDRVVTVCLRHPLLTGLGLFLGLGFLHCLAVALPRFADTLYYFFGGHRITMNQQTGVAIPLWLLWGTYLSLLFWIAAVPLLAGYTWRRRRSPGSGLAIHYERQPGEQEAARALQSQGLSLDEAALVLGRRRCPQEVVPPSSCVTIDRGIWLERAVWMVTGSALSGCLGWLLWVPTRTVAEATHSAVPLLQHAAVLATLWLGTVFGFSVLACLWIWLVRHPAQGACISRFCCLRPIVAAMALAVICAGIWCCWYGLFAYVLPPSHSDTGVIGLQWWNYVPAFTQPIVPIVLLLWLARRWRGMQTSPAPFH